METTGTVSVIIPAFNYGAFVSDAVESALAQTRPPLEIIVVDDGSTDDTPQRLARYIRDGRIRYIRQVNRGLPSARNSGIRYARGEWVAFLDADDLWHRRLLELYVSAAQRHPDASVVGSPPSRAMPELLPAEPRVGDISVNDFLTSTPITGSSVMVRRERFAQVGGFDETLTSVEDRDMWLRLASRFRVVQVDAPCWQYRQHGAQMSRRAKRMLRNFERVLRKFFRGSPEFRDSLAAGYAFMYLDAAKCYYDEGDGVRALYYLLRSWLRFPLRAADSRPAGRLLRSKLLVKFLLGPGGVGVTKHLWRAPKSLILGRSCA